MIETFAQVDGEQRDVSSHDFRFRSITYRKDQSVDNALSLNRNHNKCF